ncbi:MAG TPA: hypothetical protein VHC94_08945 [Nitrobacter sp.]|jgi:hypothetical protein|nr:hypothetical protein [Nitrobacter sp.]
MKQTARLLAVALSLAVAAPALADDLVYIPGLRIGIVPMVGLSLAKTFRGFETEDHRVKVVAAELPPAAFGDLEKVASSSDPAMQAVKPQPLETASGKAYVLVENTRDGADNVRRYSMVVSGGKFSAYVAAQVPENVEKIYTDSAVRKMLATVALRQQVPVEEQLGLLPYKIADLGGFKTVRTLAPGAVLLADSDDETAIDSKAFMIIGLVGSVPEQPDDRGRFARDLAGTIPGLGEGHITVSEPIRINGSAGYETRIDATSAKTKKPVSLVQWLVFGGGGSAMRLIGSTPKDQWETAFPRFRAVRDSIRPRQAE